MTYVLWYALGAGVTLGALGSLVDEFEKPSAILLGAALWPLVCFVGLVELWSELSWRLSQWWRKLP